jgi:hypothetical protein
LEPRVTDFTRSAKRLLSFDGVEVLRFGVGSRRGLPQLVLQMRSQLPCKSEDEPLALHGQAVRILLQRERGAPARKS